jgi:hypothetical protein
MSRYYNNKKKRKINQKLAKKRQHSYCKIADFFLDNPKYRWMISTAEPVFLTELEHAYYHRVLTRARELMSGIGGLTSEMTDLLLGESNDLAQARREYSEEYKRTVRLRKLTFYSFLAGRRNLLGINIDLISSALLTDEFSASYRNLSTLDPLPDYTQLVDKVEHGVRSRLDFFLYDACIFCISEDILEGTRCEIKCIDDDLGQRKEIIDLPYRFTLSDCATMKDFLPQCTGLYGLNGAEPEDYYEFLTANVRSFLAHVIREVFTEVFDHKEDAITVYNADIFRLKHLELLIVDVVKKIEALSLEQLFFLYPMVEMQQKWRECERRDLNERLMLAKIRNFIRQTKLDCEIPQRREVETMLLSQRMRQQFDDPSRQQSTLTTTIMDLMRGIGGLIFIDTYTHLTDITGDKPETLRRVQGFVVEEHKIRPMSDTEWQVHRNHG